MHFGYSFSPHSGAGLFSSRDDVFLKAAATLACTSWSVQVEGTKWGPATASQVFSLGNRVTFQTLDEHISDLFLFSLSVFSVADYFLMK